MADASISTPPSRSHLQRSFTLPPKLSTPPTSPATPTQILTPDGAETLFSYHSCKIVSLTLPLRARSPGRHRDSQDEEPVGVLPWRTATDRTMASGPLRLYKVRGSVVFIHSGKVVHSIFSKSRCWCVDGETIFVLRIRGSNYYRIELPNASAEDAKAAAELKLTLARVLQYETTPCPFDRGFHVELPERPEIIMTPWKPKHSPNPGRKDGFDALGIAEGDPVAQHLDEREIAWTSDDEGEPTISHERIRTRAVEIDSAEKSPQLDRTSEQGAHYVETVVTNFESMRTANTAIHHGTAESPGRDDQTLTQNGSWIGSTAAAEEPLEGPIVMSISSESGDAASHGNSSSSNSEDEAHSYPQPPSMTDDEGSISIFGEILKPSDEHEATDTDPFTVSQPAMLPRAGNPGRSFTSPVPYAEYGLRSGSPSPVEQQSTSQNDDNANDGDSAEDFQPEIVATPAELKQRTDDLIPGFGIEDASVIQASDSHDAKAAAISEVEVTADTSHLEIRTSTPEWHGLSPEESPHLHPVNLPTEEFRTEARLAQSQLPSSRNSSPSTQLRRRFHQRRSQSPMPPAVIDESSGENTKKPIAVLVLQKAYSLVLVPIVPLVGFVITLLFRLKNGLPTGGYPIDSKIDIRIPCAWESDATSEGTTSPASDCSSAPSQTSQGEESAARVLD